MSTLIALTDNGHVVRSCGANCYNAKSDVCFCICNGLNHGLGLHDAEANTRREGIAAVAAYTAKHPQAASWRLHLHLPPAPDKTKPLF